MKNTQVTHIQEMLDLAKGSTSWIEFIVNELTILLIIGMVGMLASIFGIDNTKHPNIFIFTWVCLGIYIALSLFSVLIKRKSYIERNKYINSALNIINNHIVGEQNNEKVK